jgi:ATP-binding protein involved in chromosome partitioning
MGREPNPLTREIVLSALSTVHDPELGKDLVSLGMIQDLQVDQGKVSFRLVLTTPACPMRNLIEGQAKEAVAALPGVSSVEIEMGATVPGDGRPRAAALPIRNAIAVASGKGGVGKTTVAVNVAVALAKAGARVGLLDADIYGPNVPIMMGVREMPLPHDGKMIPAEAHGVRVMSIGFLVPPGQPLIWRGPMLHSAIRQFITDVAWGELDYLVVDLPPGTGDAQLSLAQTLPLSGGLIVTLPQQVSLDDARRGLEMFRALEVPILGVVENMSFLEMPDGSRVDVFGQGGGERLAREAGVPFAGAVPMDAAVRQGGDDGRPVVLAQPDSAVARALVQIAEQVAARVSVRALGQGDVVPIHMID